MTAENRNFKQKEDLFILFCFSQAVMRDKQNDSGEWTSSMITSLLALTTLKWWTGASKNTIRVIKGISKTKKTGVLIWKTAVSAVSETCNDLLGPTAELTQRSPATNRCFAQVAYSNLTGKLYPALLICNIHILINRIEWNQVIS